MSQIDFGRALSDAKESAASPAGAETAARNAGAIDNVVSFFRLGAARFRRIHLGVSEWTNILFTVIALGGGLFCALYFFNGAELLRTASRWEREYLYPRPGSLDDAANERSRLAESLGLPTLPDSKTDSGRRGDPFSRVNGLLGLQPSNSPNGSTAGRTSSDATSASPVSKGVSAAGEPGLASPLSNLGRSAPGGDRLAQSLNRAVADMQRAAKLEARRTVIVVKNKVTQADKGTAIRTKVTSRSAPGMVRSATGQSRGRIARLTQSAAVARSVGSAIAPAGVSAGTSVARATRSISGMRSGERNGSGRLGGALGGTGTGSGALGGHAGGLGGHGGGR
jgi:hypothetical protein